ncbi:DNA protecting protein DprA [Candidatus Curtissbacteria bacterium RIFCSPLOWO2_01_FULL_39_62]|uniref:DNA protecting protein DprA n=1 Tax=Candidatus Curtissbacteria bacterium RIFCSPHIGHO2_02_FULL_40_16b TaxID=1797714 RepID=A0A1F5G6I2_9BACT|nr:MAG: DNA protecting protein DprA [Candidatus Curtissbacteria bacterium RIFCSPHIGHO2_01_FULL_39_57]OGD87490.1 MAG: DNA protecting protein DprA [Candidatus Curtissbacteria bacterium RIFCSPHIGHO2_02_FULL_40_16b]OGD91118.1 MAG: DNA protecting protein DprA [Candidatus Curtissbacteria bacterium RIFCSPHIGHO2_12_FULL_38_37]OGD99556.1 MAG: DNA protecting protein DprA [Candidatus Curtissbacteria bacterium RIFCSPLOWO2_02_FULL_40_11]OGE02868.1 MAG: DNA protecting protein DprA [Candidatus Curtissbacteria
MTKELPYWVATSAIPGVGTQTFNYLLKKFKTLKRFWNASSEDIKKLKVDLKTRDSILEFRSKVDPKIYLEKVYEAGIKVVIAIDRDYPANLRQIQDCPPVLYYKGTLLSQDDLAIAVVGSRRATIYGRQVTEKLVSSLVMSGLVIVSGLARGIDSIAHRAALDAGGRTIAVLGNGLDTIYPPENKRLAEEIVENGAIVSEFPLGFPSVPSNFPARNRIISGLSLGVLVTEGAIDSGSMITAGQAAEQGREVFAVPGPITGKMSEGANNLIKEGVHPVTEAVDILEILNIERKRRILDAKDSPLRIKPNDKMQAKILEILDGQSKHIDLIARETGFSIDKVNSALGLMEIKGFVKNYGAGMWGI